MNAGGQGWGDPYSFRARVLKARVLSLSYLYSVECEEKYVMINLRAIDPIRGGHENRDRLQSPAFNAGR